MAIDIITKITQKITKTNTGKNNDLKNSQSGTTSISHYGPLRVLLTH